jgi:hypothetical protein
MLKICLMIVGLLTAFSAHASSEPVAEPEVIVVCYPGGPVNTKDANGAMSAMLRVVERLGGWQPNSFNSLFTSKIDECKQQMAEKKPKFSIASLGLYLELRNQYHLTPVVQPKIKGHSSEHYRVMIQQGKYHNLDQLKGKTLGGTVLDDLPFIGKIVFAGQVDPASFFVLNPSNLAIRALRALDKGDLDAVILNEQQFDGLAALHLQTTLEAVFTSAEIPLMGVVANTANTTEEERGRFGKALAGMCTDTEGAKLCQLFGVDSFISVDAAVFEPMIKLWTKEQ